MTPQIYGNQSESVSKPKSLKVVHIVALLLGFFIEAFFAELWFWIRRTPHGLRQKSRAKRVSICSGRCLAAVGFELEVQGLELVHQLRERERGFLIVSNHLSFWDVLFISSTIPTLFITSVEVKETPFLGWLATLGGSTFVERRNRFGIDGEIAQIRAELREGRPVVLFPEGTSGDGTGVLPFKRSLFRSAVQAEVPIIVSCINYISIDGSPLSAKNGDQVFYYGDQTFAAQFSKVFSLREIRVHLSFLALLQSDSADNGHRELADQSHDIIRKAYLPIARPTTQESEA